MARRILKSSANSIQDRFRSYFQIHGHMMLSSLGRMYNAPLGTSLTVLVIAVSLVLPLGLYVALKNLERFSDSIAASYQISLFLKPNITLSQAQEALNNMERNPDVLAAKMVSKVEALKDFRRYSGFGEALDMLDENPLPHVIEIQPEQNVTSNPDDLAAMVQNLQRLPSVDFAQLDLQWVFRLNSILAIARRGAVLLGCLLGLAVVLIIGNTIRLELQSRHEEIVIVKLVGGTNRFISRPFLYSGFWYGFLGGTMAWLAIMPVVLLLEAPVQTLAGLYETDLGLHFLSFGEACLFIFLSSLLGLLGAGVVVVYQLKRLNPE